MLYGTIYDAGVSAVGDVVQSTQVVAELIRLNDPVPAQQRIEGFGQGQDATDLQLVQQDEPALSAGLGPYLAQSLADALAARPLLAQSAPDVIQGESAPDPSQGLPLIEQGRVLMQQGYRLVGGAEENLNVAHTDAAYLDEGATPPANNQPLTDPNSLPLQPDYLPGPAIDVPSVPVPIIAQNPPPTYQPTNPTPTQPEQPAPTNPTPMNPTPMNPTPSQPSPTKLYGNANVENEGVPNTPNWAAYKYALHAILKQKVFIPENAIVQKTTTSTPYKIMVEYHPNAQGRLVNRIFATPDKSLQYSPSQLAFGLKIRESLLKRFAALNGSLPKFPEPTHPPLNMTSSFSFNDPNGDLEVNNPLAP